MTFLRFHLKVYARFKDVQTPGPLAASGFNLAPKVWEGLVILSEVYPVNSQQLAMFTTC
jgi:hypothetical protein